MYMCILVPESALISTNRWGYFPYIPGARAGLINIVSRFVNPAKLLVYATGFGATITDIQQLHLGIYKYF